LSIEKFEQLEAWKGAHNPVLDVYRNTKTLPPDERFGLVSQMRRAAVSVPANIAEGFKRRTRPDKRHFYNIAQASLEELRYYFILCRDLGYKLEHGALLENGDRAARILYGLVKAVSD